VSSISGIFMTCELFDGRLIATTTRKRGRVDDSNVGRV